MSDSGSVLGALLQRVTEERRETHRRVIALTRDLSDEQLNRPAGPSSPSIGFHLWHLARWADYDRWQVDGTRQIWHSRRLADAWGLPQSDLGQSTTGTEMADDVSGQLPLPPKDALLDYAAASFAALDGTLSSLESELLLRPVRPGAPDRLLDLVFNFLIHDHRHLGMIEALRGMLGLQGSATN
jgi:hypothetical protein